MCPDPLLDPGGYTYRAYYKYMSKVSCRTVAITFVFVITRSIMILESSIKSKKEGIFLHFNNGQTNFPRKMQGLVNSSRLNNRIGV